MKPQYLPRTSVRKGCRCHVPRRAPPNPTPMESRPDGTAIGVPPGLLGRSMGNNAPLGRWLSEKPMKKVVLSSVQRSVESRRASTRVARSTNKPCCVYLAPFSESRGALKADCSLERVPVIVPCRPDQTTAPGCRSQRFRVNRKPSFSRQHAWTLRNGLTTLFQPRLSSMRLQIRELTV